MYVRLKRPCGDPPRNMTRTVVHQYLRQHWQHHDHDNTSILNLNNLFCEHYGTYSPIRTFSLLQLTL